MLQMLYRKDFLPFWNHSMLCFSNAFNAASLAVSGVTHETAWLDDAEHKLLYEDR